MHSIIAIQHYKHVTVLLYQLCTAIPTTDYMYTHPHFSNDASCYSVPPSSDHESSQLLVFLIKLQTDWSSKVQLDDS